MTHKPLPAFGGNSAGATAVEFALVVGPLFLLLFGTIEFARLHWTREVMQSAAAAGARCIGVKQVECATDGDYDAIAAMAFVQGRSSDLYVPLPEAAISLDPSSSCAGASDFAQVTIEYTFSSVVSGALNMLSDGVDLNVTACFPNQP